VPVLETQRRTQAERRDEAERRLLDAAAALISRNGLAGITLADVGEAAGYSRGLPAHYFGSKAGLIVRLAEHLVGEFLGQLQRAEQHPSGLKRVVGLARFYLDSARGNSVEVRALFVLLGDALCNPLIERSIAKLNARSVQAIEAELVAGVRAGEIRSRIDTKAQAQLILATLRGAVSQWLLSPKSIDLGRLRDEITTSLTRSLSA
jgi:AcrR family transcriptional regulator